jgi:hypothetical protein
VTLSDEDVARELERLRAEVRARAEAEVRTTRERAPGPALDLSRAGSPPGPPPRPSLPAPPDAAGVNEAWRAEPGRGGFVQRWLERGLRPRLDAQVAFNARQTQLDNALLDWLQARFAATHEHYDRMHEAAARRMNEIDERHRQLQEALVDHVHDIVERVDLVMEEAERGRLSLEAAVAEVRSSLRRLEDLLPPR